MRPNRLSGILSVLLLSLVFSACTGAATQAAPGVTATVSVLPAASSTPAPATLTPISADPTLTPPGPTATSNLEAICPTPAGGTVQYINKDEGYCLLYPVGFAPHDEVTQAGRAFTLTGMRQTPLPKSQETITVGLTVTLTGLADGMDSHQYAANWLNLFARGQDLKPQDATIGGQPAVVVNDLPGYTAILGAFIVTKDSRYTIMLFPQPEMVPDLAENARLVWKTVTESIVFFTPQGEHYYVRPEAVCPKETSTQHLYTNYAEGYCLLYPGDFKVSSEFTGRFDGGPVLGNVEGFGDVQTSLTLGSYGYWPNQAPRQVLQPRMDKVDGSSLQDATIGGYPAVIFRDLVGPWASRQAMIQVNGSVYTIVAQPFEPQRFANGMPYLDRVWSTVTNSLKFFTPWK